MVVCVCANASPSDSEQKKLLLVWNKIKCSNNFCFFQGCVSVCLLVCVWIHVTGCVHVSCISVCECAYASL